MVHKKRAAQGDSECTKHRNNYFKEVKMEISFAVEMSEHWAVFYADLGECQEAMISTKGVIFYSLRANDG